MRDEVAWLALGVAIGSKQLLARLLAEVPPAAFAHGPQRQLLVALGRGRESVRQLLESLGVPVGADQTAADALVEKAKDHGERQAQRALAHQCGAAARLMPPEEFRAWLALRVGEYMAPEGAKEERSEEVGRLPSPAGGGQGCFPEQPPREANTG